MAKKEGMNAAQAAANKRAIELKKKELEELKKKLELEAQKKKEELEA